MQAEKEVAEKLAAIKSEITRLGHQYFQGKLPMDLTEAVKEMEVWGKAETAIQEIISILKLDQ